MGIKEAIMRFSVLKYLFALTCLFLLGIWLGLLGVGFAFILKGNLLEAFRSILSITVLGGITSYSIQQIAQVIHNARFPKSNDNPIGEDRTDPELERMVRDPEWNFGRDTGRSNATDIPDPSSDRANTL